MSKKDESLLRQRLFKRGKPFIRPYEDERDRWLLWASYDLGGFKHVPRGLSQDDFIKRVLLEMTAFDSLWLIEDDNPHFKDQRGPCCIVGVRTDGWRIEPHFEFFFWASKRCVLRCLVQFFQKSRHDKSVGVIVGRTFKPFVANLAHLRRYGVLFYIGKIPYGTPFGDEFVFAVPGARALTKQET